jgi:hypothetical protein
MNNNELSISRERYYVGALVVLGIALLIALLSLWDKRQPDGPVVKPPSAWIQDGKLFPIGQEQKLFLERGGYHSMLLVNGEEQVKWVNAKGRDVEQCGQIVGTRIEGCDLENVSIRTMTKIILIGTSSHPCTTGSIDGGVGKVHSTNNAPNWYIGDYKCHHAGANDHK